MEPFKPVQGDHARLIGGFDVDTVFTPDDEFIQNLFKLYDQACINHIRSSTAAVSDSRFEKKAAFDLGVKESIYLVLHLIPNTNPHQGKDLTTFPFDEVRKTLLGIRNNFYPKEAI